MFVSADNFVLVFVLDW